MMKCKKRFHHTAHTASMVGLWKRGAEFSKGAKLTFSTLCRTTFLHEFIVFFNISWLETLWLRIIAIENWLTCHYFGLVSKNVSAPLFLHPFCLHFFLDTFQIELCRLDQNSLNKRFWSWNEYITIHSSVHTLAIMGTFIKKGAKIGQNGHFSYSSLALEEYNNFVDLSFLYLQLH